MKQCVKYTSYNHNGLCIIYIYTCTITMISIIIVIIAVSISKHILHPKQKLESMELQQASCLSYPRLRKRRQRWGRKCPAQVVVPCDWGYRPTLALIRATKAVDPQMAREPKLSMEEFLGFVVILRILTWKSREWYVVIFHIDKSIKKYPMK